MKGKIEPSHLERRALVYVRQSTAAQIFEHQESTKRQYALAQRAVALGWAPGAVEVIDEDQGVSGASTEGRSGFRRLAETVARGEAGAILAVEVSRLARSSEDWQRLLSLCAVARVVVIDEQTAYDPGDRDDRLLLDLKGTMSEAELHWLRLRLAGARRSKARRGELRFGVPTGYVWRDSTLDLDPDEAVQRAVRLILERFEVEPSAWAVVRWARTNGVLVPTRHTYADGTSEVTWGRLGASRLNTMLHNPTYAGVYAYGRCPSKKVLRGGRVVELRETGLDPDKWAVRIEKAHPAYISWETFLKNQERLRQNRTYLHRMTPGAAREGQALLTGLAVCGRCGHRMRSSYGNTRGRRAFYFCGGDRDKGQTMCWSLAAKYVDAAVEHLFLKTMVPDELELSLAVERETQGQAESLAQQWRARLEQAQYEVRKAERRYKAVDPDNRVVARTLEKEWEERLSEAEEVERRYADARRQNRVDLTEEERRRIRALAADLPALWRSKTTPNADRKAMLRLVIEAVALSPVEVPRRATRVRVQWRSGVVTELEVPRPSPTEAKSTSEDAIRRIYELAAKGEKDPDIAEALNAEGRVTGAGKPWTTWAVRWARQRNKRLQIVPDRPIRSSRRPGRSKSRQ